MESDQRVQEVTGVRPISPQAQLAPGLEVVRAATRQGGGGGAQSCDGEGGSAVEALNVVDDGRCTENGKRLGLARLGEREVGSGGAAREGPEGQEVGLVARWAAGIAGWSNHISERAVAFQLL